MLQLQLHSPSCLGQKIDSLVVYWKLTVLSFVLHGSFVLKYADSSNQRDFFLHSSLFLRVCSIKSANTRDRKKNFATRANFFLLCSSLFLRASVSSLLNKESMVRRQRKCLLVFESSCRLPALMLVYHTRCGGFTQPFLLLNVKKDENVNFYGLWFDPTENQIYCFSSKRSIYSISSNRFWFSDQQTVCFIFIICSILCPPCD